MTATSHPVVRTHPETGGRSLFVNPLFTDKIDGLRRPESDMLLALLHGAAVAPEHVVRWRWERGDVAFWDNRCTMHYALLDFGVERRRMLRVALEGDRPIGVTTPDRPLPVDLGTLALSPSRRLARGRDRAVPPARVRERALEVKRSTDLRHRRAPAVGAGAEGDGEGHGRVQDRALQVFDADRRGEVCPRTNPRAGSRP